MLSADSVARWSRQLDALHDRLAPHFARPEPRRRARAYLQTLLAGAERRSGNRRQPFVLAVKSSEPLFDVGLPGRSQPRAATIAAALPVEAWHVLSAGAGSKGPRAYRWAWTDLARLGWPGWRHALLVRESLKPNAKGEVERAYYVVFAPEAVTLQAVVRVAGTRWAIRPGALPCRAAGRSRASKRRSKRSASTSTRCGSTAHGTGTSPSLSSPMPFLRWCVPARPRGNRGSTAAAQPGGAAPADGA